MSQVDLLVVGGGPAGLVAARTAIRHGLSATIIDEADQLGGQYFQQPPPSLLQRSDSRPEGRKLIDEVTASGAQVLTGWAVWGVDGSHLLMAPRRGGRTCRIQGRYVLLATGAHELLLPFPGWQLPGVVTPGFALHTALEGVPLGGPVVLAGTGPFLLVVAQELLRSGNEVVAVIEESPVRPSLATALRATHHPRQLQQLAGMLATLGRHRVPWWRGTRLLSAEGGSDGVQQVRLARSGPLGRESTWTVPATVVCVAFGFRPNSELHRLLGCDWRPDPLSGSPAPITDRFGQTSVQHIYAAGDGAGIGGAELAMVRAHLAVANICRIEGRPLPAEEVDRYQRRADRLERFAAFNGWLFPPPIPRLVAIGDDLVVCRCEAVTAGEIRKASSSGWHDLSGIKGSTRAGMGPCQGRECSVAVGALTAAAGVPQIPWSPRMPVRPVSVDTASAIADPADSDSDHPPSGGEPNG